MWKSEIRRKVLAGDVIFPEGQVGDCAFVIEEGLVEISVDRGGERVVVAQRGVGEIFGEMAIIDAAPRSATVTAVADCSLLVLTREQLQSRLRGLDPVLRMVFDTVLQRFRAQMREVLSWAKGPIASAPAPESKEFGEAIARIELEQELRRGIERGEIEFHLQPIVRSFDYEIAGYEALARWRHPERGLLYPGDFVPVVEESGLDGALSRCAVDAACRFASRLRAERDPALYVSANASPDDICDPEFFEYVRDRLFEHQLEPDALCLEIVETTLITKAEETIRMLVRYRNLGVRISIDDFGAGYSNFSYLARYPVHCLKVDKSVVDQMADGERGVRLVEMIATMAQVLKIKVVAEGVETAEQAARLRDLGCDLLQGYYFGKPAPLTAIEAAPINTAAGK